MKIIPDIHGRNFWKDVINSKDDIIFLGDYVDPYPEEGITMEDALMNFKEIIEFKKSNPKVILLLGNHDFMYHPKYKGPSCRHDKEREKEIRDLIIENKDLFKMAEKRNNIIFSHAGINLDWAENWEYPLEDPEKTVNKLNELWISEDDKFFKSLNQTSYFRSGWSRTGSIIWADLREWEPQDNWEGIYQVFGHTQLMKNFVCLKESRVTDVDCRKIIDTEELWFGE